jgi:hypothetical protein
MFFYVDTFGQIRLVAQRTQSEPSYNVVDNLLARSSNRHFYTVGVFDQYLYIGYTPQGANQVNRVLIWDIRRNYWVEDSYEGEDIVQFYAFERNAGARFFAFTDTKLLELESTNGDVPIEIETGYFSLATFAEAPKEAFSETQMFTWDRLFVSRVGGVADGAGTLTVERTTFPQGLTATDTLVLEAGKPKWSGDASGNPVGVEDVWVKVNLSGSLPSGTTIYTLAVRAEGRKEAGGIG